MKFHMFCITMNVLEANFKVRLRTGCNESIDGVSSTDEG